ncbi:hypothetical protein LTR36_007846 [Oleoguttula mirabilis]|uniref:Uncharacterized protein n=1 Tax=Oleoguttula mirabilis TaxID=1507867 RepID=A0AAV9J9C2_9PEZI|nr:hypothetical protein LTR36_007846 [Oleoguttula mirabilis]
MFASRVSSKNILKVFRTPLGLVRIGRSFTSSVSLHERREYDSNDNLPELPTRTRGPRPPRREHSHDDLSEDSPRWSRLTRERRDPGPESPAAKAVRAQLQAGSEHPVEVLQAAIAEKRAPLDAARLCLQAYYEQINQLPQAQRIQVVNAKPVAGIFLQHIWDDDSAWTHSTLSDFEAQHWLCYFAVAEKLDRYILNWLKVIFPLEATQHLREEERYIWRGFLFRHLIRAYLAHASPMGADAGLIPFLNFLKLRQAICNPHRGELGLVQPNSSEGSGRAEWMTMSEWPAFVELSNALGSGKYPKTDPKLYDRFLSYAEGYGTKGGFLQRQLSIVRLRLFTPSARAPIQQSSFSDGSSKTSLQRRADVSYRPIQPAKPFSGSASGMLLSSHAKQVIRKMLHGSKARLPSSSHRTQ